MLPSYGIESRLVKDRRELQSAITDMLKDDRPYILVVNTESEGMVYPMTPAGDTVTNILMG